MKKNILIVLPILFWASVSPALALKKRVWSPAKIAIATGSKPAVGARLTPDRQNIVLTFRNATLTSSFTYELTYLGNDLEQGIFGAVKPEEGNLVSRTLYFGTCSKNACTPHKNLKNAVLTISYRLKSGASLTKRYRIRL